MAYAISRGRNQGSINTSSDNSASDCGSACGGGVFLASFWATFYFAHPCENAKNTQRVRNRPRIMLLDLKSFGIRTYKKGGGRGPAPPLSLPRASGHAFKRANCGPMEMARREGLRFQKRCCWLRGGSMPKCL